MVSLEKVGARKGDEVRLGAQGVHGMGADETDPGVTGQVLYVSHHPRHQCDRRRGVRSRTNSSLTLATHVQNMFFATIAANVLDGLSLHVPILCEGTGHEERCT